jgi:hypothetical protein
MWMQGVCYSLITSYLGSLKFQGHLNSTKLLVCRLSVMKYLVDRIFPHGLYTFEDVKAHTYDRFEAILTNLLHRMTDFMV